MDTRQLFWLLCGFLSAFICTSAVAQQRPGAAQPARIASIAPLPHKNVAGNDPAAALAPIAAPSRASRTACSTTPGSGCPRPVADRDLRMFLMLMFSMATRPSPPLK
jgi:hypothetical protein